MLKNFAPAVIFFDSLKHRVESSAHKKFLLILLPLSLFVGTTAIEVAIVLALMTFFIVNKEKQWRFYSHPVFIYGLLMSALLIFNSLWAVNTKVALIQGLTFVRFPLLTLSICFFLLEDTIHQDFLMKGLTVMILVFSLLCLYQFFVGHHLFMPSKIKVGVRLTSPFSGKMNVGFLLASLLPPVLYQQLSKYMNKPFGLDKITALLAAIMPVVAVYLSGERAATLYAFVAIGVGFIFITKRKSLLPAMMLMFFIGSLTYTKPSLQYRHVTQTYQQTSNVPAGKNAYAQLWKTGVEMFVAHPFTGIGIKQYKSVCLSHYKQNFSAMRYGACNLHPHQLLIEVFAVFGLFGALCFLALLRYIAKFVYRNRFEIMSSPIYLGVVTAILLRLLPLPSTSFFHGWGGFSFWFMTGWLLAFNLSSSSEQK